MSTYSKSGQTYRPNGHPVTVAGIALTGTESDADLAALGFSCLPDPDPLPPPEPGPFRVTKRQLRRAFRTLGIEDHYDAAIASLSPQARADFDDGPDLWSDDPMLIAAMPGAARAVGMTEAEAWAMLRHVAEGGAL